MNVALALDSLVFKATGLPDREYLNDPVIALQFQSARKKVPLLLVGWFVCLSLTGIVSFVLPARLDYLVGILFLLMAILAVLLNKMHSLHPEKGVSDAKLRDIMSNPLVSSGVKRQLQYIHINKPTEISWGDIYRLYDINHQSRF
ncbi:hypothetical protein ABWC92_000936 [Escherichia coli]